MFKIKKTICILYISTFLIAAFGAASSTISVETFAQEVTGLIASPPYITEDIISGTQITKQIHVTNHRSRDEDIYIRTREVSFDKYGNPYLPEGFTQNTPSLLEQNGWIIIDKTHFFLRRGERESFTVTINMPQNLPTRGYYLELAITTVPPTPREDQLAVTPEIVIPILINYIGTGEEIRKLSIVSFETDKPFYDFLPVKFLTTIANEGNVHIKPIGSIFVSKDRSFKKIEESIPFNEQGLRIISGSGRKFENVWIDGLFYRDAEGRVKLNWYDLKNIKFGKYHAQLTLIWDGKQGKEFAMAQTSFWVIPWQLILFILLLILITTAIVLFINKVKSREPNRKKNRIIKMKLTE